MNSETKKFSHIQFKEALDPSLQPTLSLANKDSVKFSKFLHDSELEKCQNRGRNKYCLPLLSGKFLTLSYVPTFYILVRIGSKRLTKEIEYIHFPLLGVLNLVGNSIESIEGLNRMELKG